MKKIGKISIYTVMFFIVLLLTSLIFYYSNIIQEFTRFFNFTFTEFPIINILIIFLVSLAFGLKLESFHNLRFKNRRECFFKIFRSIFWFILPFFIFGIICFPLALVFFHFIPFFWGLWLICIGTILLISSFIVSMLFSAKNNLLTVLVILILFLTVIYLKFYRIGGCDPLDWSCIGEVAGKRNDLSLCTEHEIVGSRYSDYDIVCFREAAKYINPLICEDFPLAYDGGTNKNRINCYSLFSNTNPETQTTICKKFQISYQMDYFKYNYFIDGEYVSKETSLNHENCSLMDKIWIEEIKTAHNRLSGPIAEKINLSTCELSKLLIVKKAVWLDDDPFMCKELSEFEGDSYLSEADCKVFLVAKNAINSGNLELCDEIENENDRKKCFFISIKFNDHLSPAKRHGKCNEIFKSHEVIKNCYLCST